MRREAWEELSRSGFPVPQDPPLSDVTAELTEMLGHADHALREDTALAALTTWLARGVYDDLLPGLGDGMVAGLGSAVPDRRSCSAVVLGRCIARDHAARCVRPDQVLAWGDRLLTWWLDADDDASVARGADAVEALAGHPACTRAELTVLLDVIGERANRVGDEALADQLSRATLAILRRDLVPTPTVEHWLGRLTGATTYLRSLYVHLGLAPDPPPARADLVLLVVDQLRIRHPQLRNR